MSHIRTIDPADAEGSLAEIYEQVAEPDGSVDNVLLIHSLNEHALRAHMSVYLAAMKRPSPLSRLEREIVGVAVSRGARCSYCVAHHRDGVERERRDDRRDLAEQVARGDLSQLTDRERAMVDFALLLADHPARVAASHIEALRAVGLDDRAVHDLVNVVAYFAYANRIVLGLGVKLESARRPAPPLDL